MVRNRRKVVREQQQIKSERKDVWETSVGQVVTKVNTDGVEKMIIQTRAPLSEQVGYILRTEKVPGARQEGAEIRPRRGNNRL